MSISRIPTADYKVFTEFEEAIKYVEAKSAPFVVKASGLALGKGVAICKNIEEAKKFLEEVMVKKIFGDSGNQIVIEDYLEGIEFSIHAFSDGKTFQLLPPSQDHKAVFTGDMGPNTGGMGTVAPLPWVKQELMNEVAELIVKPALDGMKKLDASFEGLLYPGLMQTQNGPKVIEFNSRFGDPECESYMRLLKTDLFEIFDASVNGKLNTINIEWENKYACCIMLASGGYPGNYEKGKEITGVEEASKLENIIVFHAGTTIKDSKLVTNGGRVLGVTAVDESLQGALDKAYAAIKLIKFEGMHYRTDIGQKSLQVVSSK
jgi:phosphoribosylamine--glycine ligase